MKILFVVCGEGLGHASRCIHLGNFMQQRGHDVHFAGYGKSYDFMDQHGCSNLHETCREVCLEGENGFFSLKKTLWESRWIMADMVRSYQSIRCLIRSHGFDSVVCDTMYGGLLAARSLKVPAVFITNQNHFSGYDGRRNAVWSSLNFLLRHYLRFADHIIIPDFPPPHTISEYNLVISPDEAHRYTFTGPLFEVERDKYVFSEKTIFASFGGEPYKLPMYSMLREIADEHSDLLFDVFYTGADLPQSSKNFLSHGYVPNLFEHLAEAKTAIVHGGLTTLHEALLFGKPVLLIVDPNHPEQQNNAKKVVAMRAGVAVDGRSLDRKIMEEKISEVAGLQCSCFWENYGAMNGRAKAAAIIEQAAKVRRS